MMSVRGRGVLVSLAVMVVLTGCAAKQQEEGEGFGPASEQSATPTATTPSPAPAASDDASAVLADGRHPVFIKTVDVAGRNLTFDLIIFLTGAEAAAEWARRHPGESLDNDYMIVNDNPRLRTLPISPSATVKMVDMMNPGGMVTVELSNLTSYHDYPVDAVPFWITVSGGAVTQIEEQFVP